MEDDDYEEPHPLDFSDAFFQNNVQVILATATERELSYRLKDKDVISSCNLANRAKLQWTWALTYLLAWFRAGD